jgi:hypothetical protein
MFICNGIELKSIKKMNLYLSTCGDTWRPAGFLIPELPNSWRCSIAEVSYSATNNSYTLFNFITNDTYSYGEFKELRSEMRIITKRLRNKRLF